MSGQARRAATSFRPDTTEAPKSPRPPWMLDKRELPKHPPNRRPAGCLCSLCRPKSPQ